MRYIKLYNEMLDNISTGNTDRYFFDNQKFKKSDFMDLINIFDEFKYILTDDYINFKLVGTDNLVITFYNTLDAGQHLSKKQILCVEEFIDRVEQKEKFFKFKSYDTIVGPEGPYIYTLLE